ncbi:hypothetical protein HY041_04025 [Candidatus Roizmanbacteria bacterium]|nr:hypothetical protein [Candidatus Roizmanbacteria bacterium]
MQLNKDQRKQLAEIIGNISVAWFSAGIISAVFLRQENIVGLTMQISLGLFFTILSTILSLQILKKYE